MARKASRKAVARRKAADPPAQAGGAEPKVLVIRKPSTELPVNPAAEKDVPFGLVILAGVFIWVLIFGGIFSYAAFSPCSFVTVVIGDRKTLDNLADKLSLNFMNETDCRTFLRLTVLGTSSSGNFVGGSPGGNPGGR